MPKILVVDEHRVFREGLCALVESNIPHAEVLPASCLVDYISQSRTPRPFDLALLDPGQSGFNSIDAIRKDCEAIAANRLAIISALDSRKNILSALGAGFHGFLPKRLHV
jgi:DNA-binding NarL/FixJ family response regulator